MSTNFDLDDEDVLPSRSSDESPEEYARRQAHVLKQALERTKLVEIKEVQVMVNQVHLLGRVKTENEPKLIRGPIKAMWLRSNINKKKENLTTSKSYFGVNDDLKYGWTFSAGSDNLEDLVGRLCSALDDSDIEAKVELEEAVLLGPATPAGSVTGGKKGASLVKAGGK